MNLESITALLRDKIHETNAEDSHWSDVELRDKYINPAITSISLKLPRELISHNIDEAEETVAVGVVAIPDNYIELLYMEQVVDDGKNIPIEIVDPTEIAKMRVNIFYEPEEDDMKIIITENKFKIEPSTYTDKIHFIYICTPPDLSAIDSVPSLPLIVHRDIAYEAASCVFEDLQELDQAKYYDNKVMNNIKFIWSRFVDKSTGEKE